MASRPGPSTFRPVAGAQQQQQQQQRPIPPTANTYPRTTPGGIQARGTPALQRGVFGAQNTQRGPTIHRGPLQNVDPPAVELTEEQRGEMVEAFNLFDLDQDGRIDLLEFKTACKALGFDLSKEELKAAMQKYNANIIQAARTQQGGPGRAKSHLTQKQFEDFIAPRLANKDPEEEVHRAFDLFDHEGKGYLTADDIRRVAEELGEHITEAEITSMIEEFDLDQDNAITRDDFLEICLS